MAFDWEDVWDCGASLHTLLALGWSGAASLCTDVFACWDDGAMPSVGWPVFLPGRQIRYTTLVFANPASPLLAHATLIDPLDCLAGPCCVEA